jgi:hypothetical protein
MSPAEAGLEGPICACAFASAAPTSTLPQWRGHRTMNIGTAALEIVGFVAAGAMGWFGTAFLGRPIRHFFDLRGEVTRRWTQCANVRARWKEDPSKIWQTVEEPGFTEADAKRLEEAEGVSLLESPQG